MGLGRIGRLHAHNIARRVSSARLIAVFDPIEPLVRNIATRYDAAWYTELEALLREAELDGVVIAAPTRLHPELVAQAGAAGMHVFCEKPLGLEAEAARHAVAAMRAAGVTLQVGFQRRFDSEWLALEDALSTGAIGRLRLFRCSHRNQREPEHARELGDIFTDVAIHDLDAARWLGGEVTEVFALEGDVAEGAASISLRFQNGALGLIDVSRCAGYGFECSAELVGSRGTARCGHRHGGIELLGDGHASTGLPLDHAERHEAAYVAELEHFAQVTLGRAPAGATGEGAVAALELVALAARSATLGVPIAAASSSLATAGGPA